MGGEEHDPKEPVVESVVQPLRQGSTSPEKSVGKGKKMDVPLTEPKGESTEKVVPTLRKRDKKRVLPKGEVYEAWDWESLVQPVSYFRDEVKLPGSGMQVLAISPSKVSDEMLVSTFGPRNASNGYTLSKGKGFSVVDVKELITIVDGRPNPLNLCLTKTLAKGIYVDFILQEPVDWASYAHDKHLAQLKKHFEQGHNKSTGPPWIRDHRVYKSKFQGGREDISKHFLPKVIEGISKLSEIAAMELQQVDPPNTCPVTPLPKVDHGPTSSGMTHVSNSVTQSPSFPFFGQPLDVWQIHVLKGAIAQFKAKMEVAMNEQHDTNSSIGTLKASEAAAQRRLDEYDLHCVNEQQEQQELMAEIAKANKTKRRLMMDQDEAQDGSSDIDEDDMEKMKVMEELMADLNGNISNLEAKLRISVDSGSEWESQKSAANTEILHIQKKLVALSVALSSHDASVEFFESSLASLREELKILTSHFEKNRIILVPKNIPTSVELRSVHFWISTCPICNLGFHCQNFVPTSCGHSYHPACILPLLASAPETPSCVACDQLFHPDWLKSWGVPCQHPNASTHAEDLGLDAQVVAHDNALTQLYTNQATLLKERRHQEDLSRSKVTFKWSKAQVAKDTKQSVAAMVARNVGKQFVPQKSNGTDLSALSGAETSKVQIDISGSEDNGELQVKIEGIKGGRKRKSSVDESAPRKFTTRSMTDVVLATTDFSPSEQVQVVKQKKLDSVRSPSKASKYPKSKKSPGNGKSPQGKKVDSVPTKSSAKSTKNNTSRRKLNIGN